VRTVLNTAGGQSFAVSARERFLRYLILGNELGTYYATGRSDEVASMAALDELIAKGAGTEAVELIRAVSVSGRAKNQVPTLIALAACASSGDNGTSVAAHDALSTVARTPTMLFEYLDNRERFARATSGGKGWGRRQRTAIQKWYNGRTARELAGLVTKYRRRGGFSHQDALRLGHVVPKTPAHGIVFGYATGHECSVPHDSESRKVVRFLAAVDVAAGLTSTTDDHAALVSLINEHSLVHEHIPTPCLGSRSVWNALVPGMPLGALLRNLNRLTALGVIGADQVEITDNVVSRLTDPLALRKARIHPMAILIAHRVYSIGIGDRGNLQWGPCDKITRALDTAFTASFAAVTPSNKRFLLALDVSGSMGAPCAGASALSCAEAAAAMAVVTAKTEPQCTAMCFADTFSPFPLTNDTTLHQARVAMYDRPFGPTDCALPMLWAIEQKVEVDVFVVYTDSETYYGSIHPCQALRRYRAECGVPHAKLVVVGMASNGFTIADPEDAGTMDVVGFDASAPKAISAFAAGFETFSGDE
jgi:60 kDa SS-A/Ro ribonucleoprotein